MPQPNAPSTLMRNASFRELREELAPYISGLGSWKLKKISMKTKPVVQTKRNPKSFFVKNFGCEKCQIQKYCPDYPAENGICTKRVELFKKYFELGKGDALPLLWSLV